jgi:peroxiredoxin (alkyl hydroperoxide reductase subunit C)
MSVAIGQPAPAFELVDQARNRVSSDSLKGKRSLVVFIPFPFTGICDDEGCAIRDGLGGLDALDANVVVITCHAVPTNAKWATENGFEFPVLSDFWPHGAVTQDYDNFNADLGVAMRSTYVLDENGVVQDIIATDSLGIGREYSAYTEALATV